MQHRLGTATRRRCALAAGAALVTAATTASTLAAAPSMPGAGASSRSAPTSYPGGRWAPGPAAYGVVAEKNVRVRMDDGVDLVADVYYPASPKTGARANGTFPVLLQQTPYTNTTGTESAVNGTIPGDLLIRHGYIYVSADVRGTGRSGGDGGFFSRRDARDGVDLVHWAARLPGSNGVVGLDGCSYLAQAQLYTAALLGSHSPVKAMLPECISGDVYRDTYFENGIPSLAWHGAGIASGSLLGPSTERYLLTQYSDSQTGGDTAYDKAFWLTRDHVAQAKAVVATRIPALLWDGWDEPGFGAQELYAALQNAWAGRSPYAEMRPDQQVTGRYQLIVGDWSHGGGLDPGIELEWFDTWLKHDDTGMQIDTETPMHLSELPTDQWVNASTYPFTRDYTTYRLSTATLTTGQSANGGGSLVYAPPQVGNTLTFTSPPFPHGATLAGPMAAHIYASSTTSNLELMADVYDVAPDGSTSLVAHGGVLGSLHQRDDARTWRDATGTPIRPYLALTTDNFVRPGTMRPYDVPIQPALWSLAPGHQLRLVIASQPDPSLCLSNGAKVVAKVMGCLPRPAILATLEGGQFTIAWGRDHPSTFTVPVLPPHAFPTARSGVTPTSNGVALPLDWSAPR